MSDKRICPECQNRLVFSGDGSELLCESCGFRRPVQEKTRRGIAELIQLRNAFSSARMAERSLRQVLKQGIGEVHSGRPEVARTHFTQVILKTGHHEEEMEAWWWLSRLIEDPSEKRLCLESVLAIDPTHGEARRELAILDGRIQPENLLDHAGQSPRTNSPREASATRMACPRCAGEMAFDPGHSLLMCSYCGHTEDPLVQIDLQRDEQFGQGALEQDFDAAVHTVRGHAQPEAVRVLSCQGCATEFVLGVEMLSMTCPYCSSVYVTEAAETAELIPPQAVVPFTVTIDAAKAAVAAWFRESKISRQEITWLSPLTGMYIPVWTFDIGGEMRWQGQVGRRDQHTGRSQTSPVFNSKYVFFNDVLIPAMDHHATLFEELLEDFDLQQIVPFDVRLLAAWPAERYAIPVSRAAAVARGIIGRRLRKMPHGLESYGDLDQRSIRYLTTGVIIESYKLVLLPLWTLHYQLEGEKRDLLINGQTGRAVGERPNGLVSRFFSWLKDE